MATEKKVSKVIQKIGFDPIDDKCMIVKYAPENLSARIAEE